MTSENKTSNKNFLTSFGANPIRQLVFLVWDHILISSPTIHFSLISSFAGVQGKSLNFFIAKQPVGVVSADHLSLKADYKRKKRPKWDENSLLYILSMERGNFWRFMGPGPEKNEKELCFASELCDFCQWLQIVSPPPSGHCVEWDDC